MNLLKKKLQAELDKLAGGSGARNRQAAFLQRDHHLTLAATQSAWAKSWRQQALDLLPDTVTSVHSFDVWTRSKTARAFKVKLFRDADGSALLAVMPQASGNINRFMDLRGTTLRDVLGQTFRVPTDF